MDTLIVITGPTASGKTSLAIDLARRLDGEIVSADSRQIYRGIPIGTATPTREEREAVPHHLVELLDLDQYYSAALYEEDALRVIADIFARGKQPILCGGSMMYVDAVCRGIDELPTISDKVRQATLDMYSQGGIEAIRRELQRLDPEYYARVDLNNHKRIIHAIEIITEAGCTYSQLRTGRSKPRPFAIKKYAIDLPREELFDRINRRVELMIEQGLVDEARRVYSLRHLNSLNTVGYKEMFAWMDGTMDYDTAVARIGKNTRVYAKKQLTWLKRDPAVEWLRPGSPIFVNAEAVKRYADVFEQ
ncbi:MAG: tRNA (adenosine(37)-N6)-dimethylallyltransferase MiaA [Muribaculaceae bacterium]|nr:tRNA (adenosine(37)-N6)-dimethylallyltransferase MiaA [Muribaculaceae bacterium]